jgi:hypothetical protein
MQGERRSPQFEENMRDIQVSCGTIKTQESGKEIVSDEHELPMLDN